MPKNTDPIFCKSHANQEARLKEIFDYLYTLYPEEIDLSLGRVTRFLARLGNPHLKLPPVIHVAGTNGKGSTVATLRSILEGVGKRVHVMTSPHLVHPTERIRLAGKLISTAEFILVLEECMAINKDEPITFFETFTAATFLAMSRVPADFAILETGMGGRLDATNVIPKPACTIITAISKDHEKFLGSTLSAIAREKAGIMKAGVPCIIAYQTDEAINAGVLKVFHDISKGLSPDAILLQDGTDWKIEPVQDALKFTWQDDSITVRRPNLLGPHQFHNCGAAIAAARVILGHEFDVNILSPEATNNPLGKIEWPGRLQKLEQGRFAAHLKAGQELWLDGGHNDSAGQALAEQAKIWAQEDGKDLHLIIAMVDRKDPSAFLKPLLPLTKSVTVTVIEEEKDSYSAEALYDLVAPLNPANLTKANTAEQALLALTELHGDCRVLITGSLYLAGTILT